MGEFDEYYWDHNKIQAERRLAAEKVANYNRLVENAQALIDAIMRHVHAGNLPNRCNWVHDKGPRLVSWRIQRGDGRRYSHNLLADEGVLARVQRNDGGGWVDPFDFVVHRIRFVPVEEDTDIRRRDIDLPDLVGAVSGLLRLCVERWKKIPQ